jgi:uncharacterized protein (UPF0261 family)
MVITFGTGLPQATTKLPVAVFAFVPSTLAQSVLIGYPRTSDTIMPDNLYNIFRLVRLILWLL